MNARQIIAAGAACAFLGVGLGAFGAHALKGILSPEMQAIYQTAVDYHFIHALGLVLIGVLMQQNDVPALRWSAYLMLGGVVIFSGSLYLLTITGQRWLGAITPFGGTALLFAWLAMFMGFISKPRS